MSFIGYPHTSTSMRAFCMAASCCTWRMTAVFGSLGPLPNESMIRMWCFGSDKVRIGGLRERRRWLVTFVLKSCRRQERLSLA